MNWHTNQIYLSIPQSWLD